LMSSLQAAVRAFAVESTPPPAICASVNRLLCGQMIAGRFATMCVLRLDRTRSSLAYVNAGHNPPLLVHADGTFDRLTEGGTVLGVFPETTYSGGEVALTSGDRLLLFTDGITEARDRSDEEYGEARLIAALRQHRAADADTLHHILWNDVTRFTAGRGFQDDATLMVVAVG
jgi:phosphoserine phosphatase RsbU/P